VFRRCDFHNAGTKPDWDSCDNIHLENCHDYLVEYCRSWDCRQNANFDASDGNGGYTSGVWQYNVAWGSPSEFNWAHFKLSGQHPRSYAGVFYNISYGNSVNGGFALQENCSFEVYGNIAYNNKWGIYSERQSSTRIRNNLMVNCDQGLRIKSVPLELDHNLYWKNDMHIWVDSVPYRSLGVGLENTRLDKDSIVADPLFTAPEQLDFSLQEGSPAINSGVRIGLPFAFARGPAGTSPGASIVHNQNYHGTGWEMGAFVYPESEDLAPQPVFSMGALEWSYNRDSDAVVVRRSSAGEIERLRNGFWEAWSPETNGVPVILTHMTTTGSPILQGARTLDVVDLRPLAETVLSSRMRAWFQAGDRIALDPGGDRQEIAHIVSLEGDSWTLDAPLSWDQPPGTIVCRLPVGFHLPDFDEKFDLRVVSIGLNPAHDEVTLSWISVPGEAYRVQVSESPDSPAWQFIGEAIIAGEALTQTRLPISTVGKQVFFRVIRVPLATLSSRITHQP
jgi:parallel beta-helix repeat protein